jgi:hypothetical protein
MAHLCCSLKGSGEIDSRSVKPDKDSIFNLTQRVVNKIETGNVNIPNYLLVTFNDYGPDINQNVVVFPATKDVEEFKSEFIHSLIISTLPSVSGILTMVVWF